MNCKGGWKQNLPSMHVHTYAHTHTCTDTIGHFSRWPWVSQLLHDFQSLFIHQLYIPLGPAQTPHVLLNTVSPIPPWTMHLSCCINHHHYMVFDTTYSLFNMSKLYLSCILFNSRYMCDFSLQSSLPTHP